MNYSPGNLVIVIFVYACICVCQEPQDCVSPRYHFVTSRIPISNIPALSTERHLIE